MLGLCKEQPAQSQHAGHVAQHGKRCKNVTEGQKQQNNGQYESQSDRYDPQLIGVFATNLMDEFAHQVVCARMGWLECAHLTDSAKAGGCVHIRAGRFKPRIAGDPSKDLQDGARDQDD